MITPGFSKFRDLMSDWDDFVLREAMEDRVKSIVNSPSLCFFFVRDGNVYGAGEASRLTFAKMKSRKNEDEPPGWKKDADFMGVKLRTIVSGDHPEHSVFSKKDLPNIKVIDQEEAEKRLIRSARQNDLG